MFRTVRFTFVVSLGERAHEKAGCYDFLCMLAGNAIAQAVVRPRAPVALRPAGAAGATAGVVATAAAVVAELPRRARKTPPPLSFSDRVFPNPARVNLAGFVFLVRVAGAKSRRARARGPALAAFGDGAVHWQGSCAVF